MFCGSKRHPRKFCPARSVTYFKCFKRGHFSKVCCSKRPLCKNDTIANAMIMGIFANVVHSKVYIPVFVNGSKANALFDSGSTLSYLSNDLSKRLKLTLVASDSCAGLAVKGCIFRGIGKCLANIELNGQNYDDVSFTILEDLFTDVMLGQDFMSKHHNVNIHLGGPIPTFYPSTLQSVKTSSPVRLFEH